MKKDNRRKKFHILLAVCMAALIIILDILLFVIPDRLTSDTENRNLQQFPSLTWNTVTNGRFESQFDAYVADQFPFRDTWIGVETTIQRLAGNTISHNIFLGSDGYLIQAFETPSEEEYNSILSGFTDISNVHSDLSIYALVAPTAVTVLDYRLPANAKNADTVAGDEASFIRRLYQDLEKSNIKTIDVESALRALDSAGTQVYYRTDHHWTTDAAYEAYKTFININGGDASAMLNDVTYDRVMVTDKFQGTLTASSGFRTNETDRIYAYLNDASYIVTNMDNGMKSATMYDMSFLDTRDKYAMFLGGNHGEIKIQTESASGKNIMVIKDSYANCFIPFLTADFSNIIVVDPRYYLGDIDQLINDEQITDILFLYNAETL